MKKEFTENEVKEIYSVLEECDVLMQTYVVSSEQGVKQMVENGVGSDAEIKNLYAQIDSLNELKTKVQDVRAFF